MDSLQPVMDLAAIMIALWVDPIRHFMLVHMMMYVNLEWTMRLDVGIKHYIKINRLKIYIMCLDMNKAVITLLSLKNYILNKDQFNLY